MKVRIIDNGSYVNLKHIVGNVYNAVKVNGYYSGYYVDVPISKNKTTTLYFLPYELEEVEEVVNDCEKRLARTSFVVILIAVILVIAAICNQIIN
jgi:hypothetical protein